jgi:hexosaminidase
LANAGYPVVLCSATNLYLDLAYEKDPLEPGLIWAGFVDARDPFSFVPQDVFKSKATDLMGHPIDIAGLGANRQRLTAKGLRRVLGIQAQLWSERIRGIDQLEYMAFPRLLAVAERAWAAAPAWADLPDPLHAPQFAHAWNEFANRVGQREMPRLDVLFGGVAYRLPPPGAVILDGMLHANVEFPGLTIRYTLDGSEPTAASAEYREPVPVTGPVKLKSFDTRGRGSRTTIVEPPPR